MSQPGASDGETEPVLHIRDLHVSYTTADDEIAAVRGVDLDVMPGTTVALVGESGSGKSTIAQSILGLRPQGCRLRQGSIKILGTEITTLRERDLRGIRGRAVGFIPQDPTLSLDPVKRVGHQVSEVLRIHGFETRRGGAARARDLLELAGLPEPAARARQYPHELSGGMRQRVLIAAALACRPALLIADEPTSALDVTVQAQILDSIEQLTREHGTAVLLITHDLGVAGDRAQQIAVMSQGRIVERGVARELIASPAQQYTRKLVASVPRLRVTAGRERRPAGGPAAPVRPELLRASGLVKEFRLPGDTGRHTLRAVDGVSFSIGQGETLALVGESGSGKSTTARLVTRLMAATAGQVSIGGTEITRSRTSDIRTLRRRIQLVHQTPHAALDPRWSVASIIAEPLRAFGVGSRADRAATVTKLLDQVALPAAVLRRRPRELSGGQCQRVAIARALALNPDIVVCDEPVSALDVTVQAQILDLLLELQRERGIGYLFISHDLAVVRQMSDRIAVMRAGKIIESGPTPVVFSRPGHDYTRQLLAAVPGNRADDATPAAAGELIGPH